VTRNRSARRRPRPSPTASNLTQGTLAFIVLGSALVFLYLGTVGHGRWINGFYESDILGAWSAPHLLADRNEHGGRVNDPGLRPQAWGGYAVVLLAVMHLPGLLLAAASLVKRRRRPWWWEAASGFVIVWYVSLLMATFSGRSTSRSALDRELDLFGYDIAEPVARAAAIGAVLGLALVVAAHRHTPSRRPPRGRILVALLVALPIAAALPFLALGHELVWG
jgi:hypothetical protein